MHSILDFGFWIYKKNFILSNIAILDFGFEINSVE